MKLYFPDFMQFADFTVRQTKSFSNLSKCSLSLKRASEKNEIWPEISASPQCSTRQRFYIEFDKDNSSTFSVLNLEKWSFCMIWCHLHNLKNGENCHRGVLLLVKMQAKAGSLTKTNTSPRLFFTFFKYSKWYQIVQRITYAEIKPLSRKCKPVSRQKDFVQTS